MEKQLRMLRKIRRALLVALIATLVVLLIVTVWAVQCRNKAVASGWGDNEGGRPSYTLEEINADVLGDSVVLNSISNSVVGNEKNFVGAREYFGSNTEGTDNIWQANEIIVKDKHEYIIRAYVHNNSPLGDDAIAKNVKVAFNIPVETGTSIPVHGFIFSDNASPSKYWDGVLFESNIPFHLEYIYGSARLVNNGVGKNDGIALSDEIVTKAASNNGTLIGYTSLNGEIPGGFQYASYVTLKVRVVFDSDYTVTAKVRQAGVTGPDSWSTKTTAKIGDKVEFQMEYRNTSENTQENVMIKDILPSNLEYVEGSTLIYNAKHDGASIDQDTIVTDGINIGNYTPGSNAFIRFTAKVVDTDLADGSNTLVNWVQCGVGRITLQDYAAVVVKKTE